MRKGKILWSVASLVAVCLLLCACPSRKTVIFRDEDGVTELYRATYTDSEPTFDAPEKDGKTFEGWTNILDEETTKVYQASYNDNPKVSYPQPLPNGITVLDGTMGIDGQDCKNLFDGDNFTYWCVDMNANAPAYVEWSTPSPVEIHGVTVTTAEDSSMNPQVWRVSYSEDGQNWHEFYSATSESNIIKEANLWRAIGIVFYYTDTGDTYTQTAQYFRLEVEQTEGNSMLKLAGVGIAKEPYTPET